jgi:peptidoglycan/xylan/chitin deacetylase (PgdA/CDA1 family)/SAM-dependent methyltransferase
VAAVHPQYGAAMIAPPSPSVSVVIAARDAASTIDRTLASVVAQTSPAWEAVVVDDGSTDGTSAVVSEWAARDARIHLLAQPSGGVSRARNLGIATARGTWLLFLDADDVIREGYLARALEALGADAGLDGVRCGRAYESGGTVVTLPDPLAAPGATWRSALARECPVAIHSCIVRRDAVVEAGGFDESLSVAEDWDLWRRLDDRGFRVGSIDEVMAIYVLRAGSATRRDYARVLAGCSTVIQRVHDGWPEAPAGSLEASLLNNLLWVVAMAGGSAGDVAPALAIAHPFPRLAFRTGDLASHIVESAPLASGHLPEHWPAIWDDVQAGLETAVTTFTEWIGAPDLARSVLRQVERRVAQMVAAPGPVRVGGTISLPIDLEAPPEDVEVPSGVERLLLRISAGPVGIGFADVAVVGDRVAAEQIRSELRRQLGPTLVRVAARRPRLLRSVVDTVSANHPVKRAVRFALDRRRAAPWSDLEPIDALLRSIVTASRPTVTDDDTAARATVNQHAESDAAHWEDIFSSPDPWMYTSGYEQLKYEQTLEVIDGLAPERVLELACAEGHFTVQLAPRVGYLLATDIAPTAVARTAQRCHDQPNVDVAVLDMLRDPMPDGFDLVVCSEVLYFLPEPDVRAVAGHIAGALRVGGSLVMAHARLLTDEPDATGFDWGNPLGARGLGQVFAETPGLALRRELRSELYLIQQFERVEIDASVPDRGAHVEPIEHFEPLDEHIARMVVWGGFAVERDRALHDEMTDRLPILMYHQIAPSGPDELDGMRVTPEAFEAQLAHLRKHGYYGVTLRHLEYALASGRVLDGRAVLLTFDDAYQDFFDHAFPLLTAYRFPATVFVVADLAGTSSTWDADLGPTSPLMDWPTIRRIEAGGVEIGSHSGPHRALTGVAPRDALRQEIAAREKFRSELGHSVDGIAYPYGDSDDVVRQTMRLAGYRLGLETRTGYATVLDDPMSIPRIEVAGGVDIETFAATLPVPAQRNMARRAARAARTRLRR